MTRTDGCRARRDELFSWLDGELEAGAALAFEEHLESCAACRDAANEHRRIEGLVARALWVPPDVGFERSLERALAEKPRAEIGRAGGTATDRRRARRLGASVAALATAACFVIAAGLLALQGDAPAGRSPSSPVARGAPPREAGGSPRAPSPTTFVLPPEERRRLAALRETVAAALRRAAQSPDPAGAFARELSELAGRRARVEALVARLLDEGDDDTARAAARVASAAGWRSTVPALLRAARRPGRAEAALEALGRLRAGLPVLRHVLGDRRAPASARLAALNGLVAYGGEAAAQAIVDSLRRTRRSDGDPAPEELAEALAQMGEVGARALVRLAHEPAAREALARHELPRPEQALAWLGDRDPRLRRTALAAAPALGPRAVPALADLAASAVEEEAQAARRALARIGGTRAWLAFGELLARGDLSGAEAGSWLSRIARTSPLDLAALDPEEDSQAVLSSLRALRGRPEAAPFLRDVLVSASCPAAWRAEAAAALADLGRLHAAEALAVFGELADRDGSAAARLLIALSFGARSPRPSELVRCAPALPRRVAVRIARLVDEVARKTGVDPPPWSLHRIARLLDEAHDRV